MADVGNSQSMSAFYKGQEVEVKSNIRGYRGAWFRCKIQEIDTTKEGRVKCLVKYLDYDDEGEHWTLEYQISPFSTKLKKSLEHMIRPLPPPFLGKKNSSQENLSGAVVLIRDWKVGDKADWWYSDCWWQCIVTNLLEKGAVEVTLMGPPFGEGGLYIARRSNLRPSLHWLKEKEWEVLSSNGEYISSCIEMDLKLLPHVTRKKCRVTFQESENGDDLGKKSKKEISFDNNFDGIPKWSKLRELQSYLKG